MNRPKNILRYTETILLIIVWLLIISIPLIFSKNGGSFVWSDFQGPLQTYILLLAIFLVNRFIFIPKLLLKKKYLLYLASVTGLIGAFSFGLFIYQTQINIGPNNRPEQLKERSHIPPPPWAGADINSSKPKSKPGPGNEPGPLPPFANLLIMSFLLVGFDTGLNAFFKLTVAENERAKLEKENVTNQLDMLRHQVSPHFLMNTLNNIHTLVDISSEKAKDSLLMLSKLMRYLLYDTADNRTTLKNEVAFIESYIELMKLRVSDKVIITLNISPEFPDKKIPPLLFTSFIENAFKHGISYKHPSFITIDITADNTSMNMEIKNSIHAKPGSKEHSGIGIENAKKRLNLLYANNYTLEIAENENTFTVQLIIPLKDTAL